MEFLIVALLIILIFKEDIIRLVATLREEKEKPNEEEIGKQEAYKREFDKMMGYSIEDAIKSKRSEIDG